MGLNSITSYVLEHSKEYDLNPSVIYTLLTQLVNYIKETKRMQAFSHLLLSFLVILFAISCSDAFTRNDFPEDFLFGAATSAYQVRRLSLKFQRTLLYLKFDCSVFCYSGKERLMKTEGLQASGILSPTLVSFFFSCFCFFFVAKMLLCVLPFNWHFKLAN